MGADSVSIDLLLREHSDFVARLARRLLADHAAAQDLSQDAWRTVIERRAHGIVDFRAWLAGVLRNLARMHRRGEAARQRREQCAAAAAADRADDAVAHLDELERLVAALRRLREPFRTVVLLRYREGLAPRAIARQAGVPVATVKSRLKRGLLLLRADLRSAHGGDDQAWRRGVALLLLRHSGRHLRRTLVGVAAASLAVLTSLVVLRSLPRGAADRLPAVAAADLLADAGPAAAPDRGGAAVVRVPLPAAPAAGAGEHALRFVDRATGEPVPGFLVAAPVLDPPLLVTDREGILRFAAEPGRPLELRLIDDVRLRPERPIEAAFHGEDLHVTVGPTYRLDLQPPPGDRERFDARLVALDADRQHRTSFAPVRLEDIPWVRFAADARHVGGGPPWRLEVRGDDGYRLGWAEVGSVTGVQRGHVTIVLAATGVVQGRIAEPDGQPVDQAEIVLEGEGREYAGATDPFGAFELPWIEPGAYALRASSRRHAAAATRVAVQAGATAQATLQVLPLPDRAGIEGILTSELATSAGAGRLTSIPPGAVAVVLTQCDDADVTFVRTVTCAADPAGGPLASFRFEGIPAGRYQLAVRAPDFCRWRPPSLAVTPGQHGIELRRRDAEPVTDLELRAVDAPTGATIADFDAFVRLDGDGRTAKVLSAQDGRLRLLNVPLDASIEWTVRAAGHAPQSGGRAALASPVRLEPGWSNTLRCIDRDGRPAAGVAFVLDGEPAGATGADGLLLLRRSAPPASIVLPPGLWNAAGGDLLPEGRFRDLIWGITVRVEPAAREHEERK